MNHSIKIVGSFVAGAAIGAYGMYRYIRSYFENKTEEELKEIREYYANKYETGAEEENTVEDDEGNPSVHYQNPDISEYKQKLESLGYIKPKTDYAHIQQEEPVESKRKKPEPDIGPKPFRIPPEEYGGIEGYMMYTLTYFADGVLVDEDDIIVDDIEATVGDALDHFGEYENDSVWVRNDRRHCDYEILKSNGTFEELADRMPVPVEV